MLLLRTVHGSRLYGFAHADSDYDWYEVHGYDKFKTKQKLNSDQDTVRISLDKFLLQCEKGVPQALEAMFSQQAEVDVLSAFRQGYRVNMTNVRDTYARTIKSFWLAGTETGDYKRKRHACRLAYDLKRMHYFDGRFNPTLGPWARTLVDEMALEKWEPEELVSFGMSR